MDLDEELAIRTQRVREIRAMSRAADERIRDDAQGREDAFWDDALRLIDPPPTREERMEQDVYDEGEAAGDAAADARLQAEMDEADALWGFA